MEEEKKRDDGRKGGEIGGGGGRVNLTRKRGAKMREKESDMREIQKYSDQQM